MLNVIVMEELGEAIFRITWEDFQKPKEQDGWDLRKGDIKAKERGEVS